MSQFTTFKLSADLSVQFIKSKSYLGNMYQKYNSEMLKFVSMFVRKVKRQC